MTKPQLHALLALCAVILFIQGSAACFAQQAALPGSGAAGSPPESFQRNVRAGTETLDAISRLVLAIKTRRAKEIQDLDPSRRIFSDVPLTDDAYSAMATLVQHRLVLGYPDGYFTLRRIQTRYTFAVALARMLQSSVILSPLSSENSVPSISRADLNLVSTLVRQFDMDLRLLGINAREVRKRLNARLSEK